MGQEIEAERFRPRDFEVFRSRLAAETDPLEAWFREGRFASGPFAAGLELDAWLVDTQGAQGLIDLRIGRSAPLGTP